MSSGLIVGLEVLLVFGCVLGLAGFELWQLRRDRQKRGAAVSDSANSAAPAKND